MGSPLLAVPAFRSGPEVKKTIWDELPWRIPPYLKSGDTIGITCPAGFMTRAEIEPAVRIMKDWGFNLRIGKTVGLRDFTFGGTDEQRLSDLQQMLDDPLSRPLCVHGEDMDVSVSSISLPGISEKPKWIVGFSDITVLHAQLNHGLHIASIHSKMCNSFPENPGDAEKGQWDSIVSIQQALTGKPIEYPIVYDPGNRVGSGRGLLAGGNLKTIETLAGTSSDLQTDGMILFLEDAGEYLYSIDRMFYNLKRTGKLKNLSGLLIGGFRMKPMIWEMILGKAFIILSTIRWPLINIPFVLIFR